MIQYEEREMVLFELGYDGSFSMTALGKMPKE